MNWVNLTRNNKEEIVSREEPTVQTNEKEDMNKKFSVDFAFRHGPRRDGTIRKKKQLADCCTKPLPKSRFDYHRLRVMSTDSSEDKRQ